ncbi:uncharacterized protein LOC122319461 [Drosophila yakuba]|uniref:uncharacterized protein LOC122319461 n=1 Tax=Drosophila yakuba TaxID=7245 RepID=UPI001C89F551|nr:uncharacterized protein LOC122319461 [Drosophila yakuba]
MEELVAKLPTSKRVDWARHAATIAPFSTVVHFSAWLQEYPNVVCTVLWRTAWNIELQRIYWSFATGKVEQCECQINGCRREHHRLLHGADEERRPLQRGGFRRHEGNQQPAVSRRSPARRPSLRDGHRDQERNRQPAVPSNSLERGAPREAEAPMQRNLSCVDAEGGRLLFRILPVTLYGAGRKVDTYALLDEGSSVTMSDDELRRDLGVQGERRQLNIQWFGGKATREPTNVVSLKISGVGKPTRHVLKNFYAVSSLSLPMQTLSRRDVQGVHRDARLPMKPYSNVVPKLLIGLDHGHLGLPLRTRRFAREGPYAAATKLGWVVFGPVSGQPTTPSPRSCLLAVSVDDAMEKMVEDYFDMENFGVKPAPPVAASDDVRAQRILEDTTVKVGRRYQTGLLWKDDHVVLPPSYEMEYRRLVNVEKKMKRNKPLAQEYDRIIKDYVSKGYARRLQPEEVAVRSDRLWYLPHFGVENPNKPGKVRLVFDAAAKVGGTSLNSELDKGPQHYKPLPAVLFHFREGAVGVCGDIKEMFHQVLIRPEDRCSQRFLWRDGDDERDPDVYEMNVMTFGAACSPSASHYVKTMNALKYRDSDPKAVKAITDYHYVDDYVDSFATESEAISVSTRVKEIHKDAGFELCQFSSSSPTVETALGPGRVKSVGWGEAEEKILGMRWQVAKDDFRFNVEYHRVPSSVLSGDRVPTKREYLSLVMSTFDPLGFLCCLMVTAKLLLREIWRQKIQWDEPLPEELSKMDAVGQFRCPRHYFGRGAVRAVELHVFADASQAAFAAVAYWRVTYEDDDVQVSFVSAKTKCAPIRTMTIPRLELQAAVLGTRLMNTVKEEHSVVITDLVLWTDSKTVLRWIGSTHRRYKQFVGNRVAEILESSKVSQWRWVPTADNAADDATRSQKGVDLSQESRGIRGPAFLRQPAASWPGPEEGTERVPDAPDVEEMPSEFALVAADDFVIPFQRFSSFSRLVRTTARVLRFTRWCRKQRNELEEYGLTAAECKDAENLLVRQAQLESFPDEMMSAETGQDVARSSDIRGLVPYLRLCAARSGAAERSTSTRVIWSSSAMLPWPDESGARASWRRSTHCVSYRLSIHSRSVADVGRRFASNGSSRRTTVGKRQWLSAVRRNEKFAERTVVGRRQAGRFGRSEIEVQCNKKFDVSRRRANIPKDPIALIMRNEVAHKVFIQDVSSCNGTGGTPLTVKRSQLAYIKNCSTAVEAWNKLREVHQPSGPVRKVQLYKKMLNKRMEQSQSMSTHISDFVEILDGLAGVGIELNDELRTIVLLSSLPEEFKHFVVAMESRDQLPTFEILTIELKEKSERKGIAEERIDNTNTRLNTEAKLADKDV